MYYGKKWDLEYASQVLTSGGLPYTELGYESPCSSNSESLSDMSSVSNGSLTKNEHKSLDFKLIVDDVKSGQQLTVHLVGPTRQEKAAWITDIAQCMDNVHFNGLFYNTMPNANSSTLPQCVKSDPNLFKDDVDIRFSKTFNTCKIPQIRYATPERLLQRLTDLRFLNIDFLNTFLLTYRVFTDGITVLEALKNVFFHPEPPASPTSSNGSMENIHRETVEGGDGGQASGVAQPGHLSAQEGLTTTIDGKRRISTCSGYSTATENGLGFGFDRGRMGSASPRRISGASSISGYYSDDRDGGRSSLSQESSAGGCFLGAHKTQHWRYSFRKYEEEQRESANNGGGGAGGGVGHVAGLGVDGHVSRLNRSSITSLPPPLNVTAGGRKGSHDSIGSNRSGSIVSNAAMWRKESVTIIERAEDGDDDEEADKVQAAQPPRQDKPSVIIGTERRLSAAVPPVTCVPARPIRRASSGGDTTDVNFLTVPNTVTASSSAETLTDNTLTAPPTPTNVSVSLIPSPTVQQPVVKPDQDVSNTEDHHQQEDPQPTRKRSADHEIFRGAMAIAKPASVDELNPPKSVVKKASLGQLPSWQLPQTQPKGRNRSTSTFSTASSASACYSFHHLNPDHDYGTGGGGGGGGDGSDLPMGYSRSQPCSHHPSFSGPSSGSRNIFSGISFKDLAAGMKSPTKEMKKRKGLFQRPVPSSEEACQPSSSGSPLSSPQHKMGVVITSSRQAHRSTKNVKGAKEGTPTKAQRKAQAKRNQHGSKFPATDGVSLEYFLSELSDDDSTSWSSSASAAVAFAVATAGSGNPPDHGPPNRKGENFRDAARRKCSITSNVSTLRVLSVLRHWVTKHSQDFETNQRLKNLTIEFLEDIICTPTLLPSENRASSQLLRMLTKEEPAQNRINLDELLTPTQVPSKESVGTLSALEIAEQMTYLDQNILFTIMCSEFLEQAWAKSDKNTKAPHIVLMTKRFNDMSRLVVSEILTQPCITTRVQAIEKWTAVADICRCLHNFNGVLQLCAAFTNSAVYRLKNTWGRVSKSTRQTVEKLQSLVSSDGRFRNLRDSLHRTDPPCIPYLGMYLSDLTFIEEGTPNFTDNGLLNFAKMRMIAHVIREIRQFQQTPYKIEPITKVLNYLLDQTRLLEDEDLYQKSLILEPRTSRLSSSYGHGVAAAAVASKHGM